MKHRRTRFAPAVALAAVALIGASAGCENESHEDGWRDDEVAALDAPADEADMPEPAVAPPPDAPAPAGAMDAASVEPIPAAARDGGAAQSRVATAALESRDGEDVGEVRLTETPNGLIVEASFTGLAPGTHAFHIHETGECDPETSFESAGGHFAPGDQAHGFLSEDGRHAGDLPNVEIPESSRLDVTHFLPEVTLDRGELGLMDDDGAAVVIHESADDYRTDPAGQAGPRVACGVIENGEAGPRLSLR